MTSGSFHPAHSLPRYPHAQQTQRRPRPRGIVPEQHSRPRGHQSVSEGSLVSSQAAQLVMTGHDCLRLIAPPPSAPLRCREKKASLVGARPRLPINLQQRSPVSRSWLNLGYASAAEQPRCLILRSRQPVTARRRPLSGKTARLPPPSWSVGPAASALARNLRFPPYGSWRS